MDNIETQNQFQTLKLSLFTFFLEISFQRSFDIPEVQIYTGGGTNSHVL